MLIESNSRIARPRWRSLGALALLLVASACASGAKPPKPPAPEFSGSLVVEGQQPPGTTMVWRISRIEGGKATAVPLLDPGTPVVQGTAALSPDGTSLAYVSGRIMTVRSLAPAAQQITVPPVVDGVSCAEWAPDGKHVAFTTHQGVFSVALDGTFTMVATRKSAIYSQQQSWNSPGALPTGGPQTVYSSMSCARWLDNDHLAFDRLKGDMPLVTGQYQAPSADVSTIAAVQLSPQLDDLDTRWTVDSSCGSHVLVDAKTATDDQQYVFTDLLKPGGGDPNAPQQTAKHVGSTQDGSMGTLWFFQPGSCDLVRVTKKSGQQSGYTYTVTTSDPSTGAVVQQRALPIAVGQGAATSWPMSGNTVVPDPSAASAVAAYAESYHQTLNLVDLRTGGAVVVDGPWAEADQVLGWSEH
ncbi:hypothetical protein P3T36_007813 [Kitasatospora sp. MAP12-15]|uniref:TolB family protein n=1 Tax=unclassified Kitasatospora TaxID=2633591 RepID=UPI0024757C9B|nr:hypothetical protein [Kitasatospora sp. MAP12-44]MDH6108018.1 hypothetical protein [Kitasatospora sp. MAP12-44]